MSIPEEVTETATPHILRQAAGHVRAGRARYGPGLDLDYVEAFNRGVDHSVGVLLDLVAQYATLGAPDGRTAVARCAHGEHSWRPVPPNGPMLQCDQCHQYGYTMGRSAP